MIADEAFAGLPAYDPGEFCDARECPCGSEDITCLPTDVYVSWRASKARLPKDVKVQFQHIRECLRDGRWEGDNYSEESAGPDIYAAQITLPVGPFTMERLVKIQ
jgi:hypothetical protein